MRICARCFSWSYRLEPAQHGACRKGTPLYIACLLVENWLIAQIKTHLIRGFCFFLQVEWDLQSPCSYRKF